MSAGHTWGTAADGKTQLINVPGHPLLVSAVEFNRLVAQRDELLEALRPFASIDLRTQGVHHRFADDVLRARAAIAKVEGGAA